MTCEYCSSVGGTLIWEDELSRVVWAPEPAFVGFCRVIWKAHVSEMTDLSEDHQNALMRAVFAAGAALRETLRPIKVNLASLGNLTPHLHWQVIPRYSNDSHFPSPVWSAARRPIAEQALPSKWQELLRTVLSRHLRC